MVIREIKRLFVGFNKLKINYCILRNYEFLFGTEEYVDDIDVLISSKNILDAHRFILNRGFQQVEGSFHEKKYLKYLSAQKKLLRLHLHIDRLYYHNISFLESEKILKNKRQKAFFYIPSREDLITELILHSILRKKFKNKYKKIIEFELRRVNPPDLFVIFNEMFSRKLARKLLSATQLSDYNQLINLRKRIVVRLLNYKNVFRFLKSKVQNYLLAKTKRLDRPNVFAFMGADGAGKTTLIRETSDILRNNKYAYKIVYMGRWRNISKVRKAITHISRQTTKQFYLPRQIVWVMDLCFRYIKLRFSREKLILTDRYAYDLLMERKINSVISWIIKIFPKPDLIFLLYNDPTVLAERKNEVVGDILIKSQKITKILSQMDLNVCLIKTNNLARNRSDIAKRVFEI